MKHFRNGCLLLAMVLTGLTGLTAPTGPVRAAVVFAPDAPLVQSDPAGTRVLKEDGVVLSPQQALARQQDFGAAPPVGSVRIGDTYWVLSRVRNALPEARELRIDFGIWDEIETHLLAADGSLRPLKVSGWPRANYLTLGDANPFTLRHADAHSRFSVFTVAAGSEVTLLTRLRPNRNFQPTTFIPSISDHGLMLELRRYGLHLEGIQAGILIALGLFGWFSVVMNRDRTSLAYGIWIVFALLSATSFYVHDGQRFFEFYLPIEGLRFGSEYLGSVVLTIFAYGQSMFYVIFARNFLELKTTLPRVYRITNLYLALTVAHGILVCAIPHTLPQMVLWVPLFSMIIAMLLTIFACAWIRLRQGLRIAGFFMVAMVPYLFFRSIVFLGLLNVPSPFSLLEKSGFGLFLQSSNTAQAFGLCAEAIIMAFAVITRNRWLQDELGQRIEKENHRLEQTVAERTRELLASKQELERQHEIVVDSIRYASRLQRAQLPRLQRLGGQFASFHAIWEPRDTIGGDVWWASLPDAEGRTLLAVADSTGHGVPGAMLSVLVSTSLERIHASQPEIDPGAALMALDAALRTGLNQDSDEAESDDGCDAAIVRIDPARSVIEYAGAKLALLRLRADGAVERIQASRLSLGYRDPPHERPQVHRIDYRRGDSFVLVSDGFTDQVGSLDGALRAYGYRRLQALLQRLSGRPAQEIAAAMRDDLRQWQGAQMRRDDVTAVVFQPA